MLCWFVGYLNKDHQKYHLFRKLKDYSPYSSVSISIFHTCQPSRAFTFSLTLKNWQLSPKICRIAEPAVLAGQRRGGRTVGRCWLTILIFFSPYGCVPAKWGKICVIHEQSVQVGKYDFLNTSFLSSDSLNVISPFSMCLIRPYYWRKLLFL